MFIFIRVLFKLRTRRLSLLLCSKPSYPCSLCNHSIYIRGKTLFNNYIGNIIFSITLLSAQNRIICNYGYHHDLHRGYHYNCSKLTNYWSMVTCLSESDKRWINGRGIDFIVGTTVWNSPFSPFIHSVHSIRPSPIIL